MPQPHHPLTASLIAACLALCAPLALAQDRPVEPEQSGAASEDQAEAGGEAQPASPPGEQDQARGQEADPSAAEQAQSPDDGDEAPAEPEAIDPDEQAEPAEPEAQPAPGSEVAQVAPGDDPGAIESAATRVPMEEIRRYVRVFNAVREGYVDPVDDRKLMQSAIEGLLLDLDPHSAYLVKSDAEAFDENSSGAYEGIGVEVLEQPDGSIRVIAPIDGTPAQRAGIQSGDVVIAVDGKTLEPSADEHGPLRGKPGSTVVLTIVREGRGEPFDVSITRDTIRVASVRSRMLEPGYGYVRLSQFQSDTAADFEKALARLHEDAGGKLKGLAIDLRSNPGGLLTSAVQIADDLLEAGRIVTTKGRVPISDAEFGATPGDRMHGAPVVVLVDAGSASASEVLAGALRDNGRARIVGSRTFGKGSVQAVLPLGNGDSVKLTTARYYTPSGKSIQALGITPDVVLQADKQATALPGQRPYSEAALAGHLRGDAEGEAGSQAGDVLEGDGPIDAALAELKKQAGVASAASTQRD